MSPEEASERVHDAAVKLFGIHATNPALSGFGVPGGGMGLIHAANTLLGFVRAAQSERSARAAVARAKATPKRQPSRTRIRRIAKRAPRYSGGAA